MMHITSRLAGRWRTSILSCSFFAAAFSYGFAAQPSVWVGSWASAPVRQPESDRTSYSDVTVRNVVHLSLGGTAVRIKLSNEFGATSLKIDDVHLASSAGASRIDLRTDHKLTFGGQEGVEIPAGALAVSDPIELSLPALSDVAVSFHLPKQTLPMLTYHPLASSSNYLVDSDQVAAPEMEHSAHLKSWYVLTGVDVISPAGSAAVITLGDSITDGAHSTLDKNARWPDVLAARLHANVATAKIGVLNEGVSGNRVLHNAAGINALARLDRDVLAQSGAKYLVLLEGINDIRYATNPRGPDDAATAQQLIWGLQQIAIRAHARGLKVYCGTLTPFGESKNANQAGEEMRGAINAWIRTTKMFDAVLDFDRVTRDVANPLILSQSNDSGDHLHPGDMGYKAMADSIDLNLFVSQ
jgi:lysophospholipase L1-like esterase